MRIHPLVQVLRSSAAIGALVLGAAEANAACTTVNGVVTCRDGNTSDQVNASVNSAPPPSVSLVIAEGATVTRGAAQSINPSTFRFPGAIGYTNSGVVGAANANVDFFYFGTSGFNGVAVPANTFTFTNNGIQNGSISAFNIGGAISGTNSGTVTRGIDLRGVGAIAFTNTGSVFNTGTFGGGPAITLNSSLSTSQIGSDGVSRSSETGGAVTATIGGSVGIPATASAAFQPQGVSVRSVGGVVLAVDGRAGAVSASSSGSASETFFRFTGTGNTSTSIQNSDSRSIGADAQVTIGATGRVTNLSVSSGPGMATVIVNGTVEGDGFSGVNVNANGSVNSSRFSNTQTFAPFTQDNSSSGASRATGGAALAEISTTGRVDGGVSASSNAGSATVLVAGRVEALNAQLSASSTGVNSASQSRFVSRADGTSEGNSSATQSRSGGAALVAVASTGEVGVSFLSATGDTSALIDNAGLIRASVSARSDGFVDSARSNSNGRTITTDAAGVRTEVSRSESTSTTENLGGTATINNRLDATIRGTVQASGTRGATLDNAGTIAGSVFLDSNGSRTVSANTNNSTATTTPVSGGGSTFTSVQDSSNSSSSRPTGGGVTGIYSGTVGVAQTNGTPAFGQVSQNGTTASTATVTGTILSDFFGNAAGQNRDSLSTSSFRQTIRPDGSSTRSQSSTSRDTTTQTLANSSLTVGSTGRIGGIGNGSANVTAGSGNAVFNLDGGRIGGSVFVAAGSNPNTIQTSQSESSFTRAAPNGNVFTPDIQQTQTSASSFDQREAAGIAIARINGGVVNGDLSVTGTGTGAGSLGAEVLMNGTVNGELSVLASSGDFTSANSDVQTRTGPTAVTRTTTNRSSTLASATRGGVLANVGGIVGGGIVVGADIGDATLNLTGRAGTLSPDGVTVLSFLPTRQSETVRTSMGTSFFGEQTAASRTTNASVVIGGAATLNIPASPELRATGASSSEGDVFVQGFAGSTLNVAAGSRINQATGGILVGATFFNTTDAATSDFLNGALTGSTQTSTATAVGGLATVNNAGTI